MRWPPARRSNRSDARMPAAPRPGGSATGTRYGWPVSDEPQLSHLDSAGRARMVDVGGKAESDRRARARAVVRMSPETAAIVERGDAPKGDVLGTARIAGIQAAKRTDELIPLAHPLPLTFVDVEAEIDAAEGTITFVGRGPHDLPHRRRDGGADRLRRRRADRLRHGQGLERGVVIEEVALLEKTGGKEDWRRDSR